MSSPALAPCEAFVAPLGARAVGGLDDAGRAALEAHLATGCAGCAALAADLEAALDAVRLPEEEPAPGGWERVRLRLDDAAAASPVEPVVVKVRCTYCKDDLAKGPKACCATCLAPHHADCFAEHGRCAAPGCAETRTLAAAPDRRPTRRLPWLLGGALVLAGGSVAAWQVAEQRERDRAEALRDQELARLSEESRGEFAKFLADARARESAPPEPEALYEGQPRSYWLASLADRSPDRRSKATQALVSLGPDSTAGVAALLDHEAGEVRAEAARTLTRLGALGRGAIEPIARALSREPSAEVRRASLEALGAILAALGRTPTEPDVRLGVVTLEDRLLRDPDDEVRRLACLSLAPFVPHHGSVAALTTALGDQALVVRYAAANSLGRVEPNLPECVEALAAALAREESEELRDALMTLLVTVKPAELRGRSRQVVAGVLLDPAAPMTLRDRAAYLLGHLEPVAARDLLPLLQAGTERAGEELRSQPNDALERLLARLPALEPDEASRALAVLVTELPGDEVPRLDPDGPVVGPLLAATVAPAVRVRAAYCVVWSHRWSDRTVRAEVNQRLAPRVLRDLLRALDDSRGARNHHVDTTIDLLGPLAAEAAERLLERLQAPVGDGPDRALQLLASVAPSDSRTAAAVAAALDGAPAARLAGLDAMSRLGAGAGEVGAEALGRLLAEHGPTDEALAANCLKLLERHESLRRADPLVRFAARTRSAEQATLARALAARTR